MPGLNETPNVPGFEKPSIVSHDSTRNGRTDSEKDEIAPAPVPPAKPKAGSIAPVPSIPVQTNRKAKAANTFEAAKDRKVEAATDVATGGDRFVAEVLETAEQKANAKLAAQKESLVEELSEAMVEHRLSQARTSVDFFMNQWGSTDALLNPYRQAMEQDEEIETIEVSAS